MRRPALVLSLLFALLLPVTAVAAPQEAGWDVVDWLLERLEPVLAFVAPDSVGPGADPDGLGSPPPPPAGEQEVGPGADPDG